MGARFLLRLAVTLTVVASVLTIGGMWWWALLDVTPEVGAATMGTAFAAAIGAAVAWGAWAEAR